MKHRTLLAAVRAPSCAGLVVTAGPTYAGASAGPSTGFAFKTSGLGTRATGGQVPVGSATTAHQSIGAEAGLSIERLLN